MTLLLSPSSIGTNDNFEVMVTVHNTGPIAGKEVLQVNHFIASIIQLFTYREPCTGAYHGYNKLRRHS